MRGSKELSIGLVGGNDSGDTIWGRLEMLAHRRVSRWAWGWKLESSTRRSCGRALVGGDAAWSALELAGVSSRRRLRCGRAFCAGEAREREWTRPGARGRRRGGHAHVQRWWAGPETAYGHQMSPMYVAGRPRRRGRCPFRACDACLTKLLWRWLTSKPWRIRRWCSWHSWSTNRVLQVCQLEQRPNRLG